MTTEQTPPFDDLVEEPIVVSTPVDSAPEPVDQEVVDTIHTSDYVDASTKKARVNQNVSLTHEIFSSKPAFNENLEAVALPPDSRTSFNASVEAAANVAIDDNQAGREWLNVGIAGLKNGFEESTYERTLEAADAEFIQEMPNPASEGGKLSGVHPSTASFKATHLQGERAVLRSMTHLGMGSIFRFPLWNSGFWMTLKPPSESTLLEFQRSCQQDKIRLGRSMGGTIFSNNMAYQLDRFIQLIRNHVYVHSLDIKEEQGIDIMDLISIQDVPTLIWGLANTIYPNGFQYVRACSSDVNNCNHVTRERLNLSKICWVNRRGLADWQVKHMSSVRQASMKLETVERYRKELLASQQREINVDTASGAQVGVALRVPSVNEAIRAGHSWIGELTELVNNALGMEPTEDARNAYIDEHSKSTGLRQYVQWVQSVTVAEQTYEDRDTIEAHFGLFSTDSSFSEDFIAKASKYVDDSTISVIGIPTYDCPDCGQEQKAEKPLPRHVNIIPIDTMSTFFSLLVRRKNRITRQG